MVSQHYYDFLGFTGSVTIRSRLLEAGLQQRAVSKPCEKLSCAVLWSDEMLHLHLWW